MTLKIGDTLYRFDVNRRVYDKPEPGRLWSSGGPIYSKHYEPLKITGENSRSWLTEGGFKCPKRDNDRVAKQFLTAAEMAEDCWQHDHRYRIQQAVERCSVEVLREVARIVGYKA